MKRIQRFAPVVDEGARVLILGSIPGNESLRRAQYYANPRNAFWRIMGEVLGFDPNIGYEQRLQILQLKKIALWDVVESCVRKSSLDADIKASKTDANAFIALFEQYRSIEFVLFNGAKAEQQFTGKILAELGSVSSNLQFARLPSTSPANAAVSYDQKLASWRKQLAGLR